MKAKRVFLQFLIVFLFLSGCDRTKNRNVSSYMDFSEEKVGNAYEYASRELNIRSIGILKDTIEGTVIDELQCDGKSNKLSLFVLLTPNNDTIRVIFECSKTPRYNDSINYLTDSHKGKMRFVPAPVLEKKWDFVSWGNVLNPTDSIPLFTTFGVPVFHIRPIPVDINTCMTELDFILGDDSKTAIRNDYEELGMHFGLGMWIRNNWGLWAGTALNKYFAAMGTTHPDHMSGRILSAYEAYLRGEKDVLNPRIFRGVAAVAGSLVRSDTVKIALPTCFQWPWKKI